VADFIPSKAAVASTDRVLPIDLDAMKTKDGWFEAPSWPCSVTEIGALHAGWWRTLLDVILESAPGVERDAILLNTSAIISRTTPLLDTAFALEQAEAKGMCLAGGPPEIDYLRGDWADNSIPHDTVPDTKGIVAARHPFIRSILSTRRFTPMWKIPFRLAMHQGKVVAHNDLLFPMARACGTPMVFDDAGAMFNGIRRSYQGNPPEDQVSSLAKTLTNRLVGSTPIGEPYRSRLSKLVLAKLSRILRITLRDVQATRQAKLPNMIWGSTGSHYAARAMAIEILRRGGETRFFTHAGTASMTYNPVVLALSELAASSTFVLETPAVAEQEEMVEACQLTAPLHKTRIIGTSGNKGILNLPLRRQGRAGKRAKVVYVGTPSRGFGGMGPKAMPEVIFLDWQFRLVKFLNSLPIDLICKPHPSGYFSGQRHPLESIATTEYGKFEALMESADVFIFDGCMTTTIWEALCTDRRLVYFDLGIFRFLRAAEAMLRRRSRVISPTYDDGNRPQFDPNEVEAAVLDTAPVDPTEFQRALIGETA
jgi:hypothetical protein